MKEYEVIGTREVLGHQPGERFSLDIPKVQEERLLKRGALQIVKESSGGSGSGFLNQIKSDKPDEGKENDNA